MSPINFQELPSDSPYAVPPVGFHKFVVTKATMTKPKNDPNAKDYLLLQLDLYNRKGQKVGNIQDRLFDSDKPAMRYKLQRFMTAMGLQALVTFELTDLPKLVLNREGVVEIEHDVDFRDKGKPVTEQRQQAQTRVFGSEIYWPIAELDRLVQDSEQAEPAEPDVPFLFDAADGQVPPANKY